MLFDGFTAPRRPITRFAPVTRIARTHLRVREFSSCGLRANGQQTASAPPQADKVEALGPPVPPVILLSACSLNSMSPGFLTLVFALSSDLVLSLTLRDFAVGNLDRVIAFLLSSSIFDFSETSSVNRRHRSQVRVRQRRRRRSQSLQVSTPNSRAHPQFALSVSFFVQLALPLVVSRMFRAMFFTFGLVHSYHSI